MMKVNELRKFTWKLLLLQVAQECCVGHQCFCQSYLGTKLDHTMQVSFFSHWCHKLP